MDFRDCDNMLELTKEPKKWPILTSENILKGFTSNVPNQCTKNAFITGFSFDSSFEPRVGNCEPFFETENERIKIWKYKENADSVMVSEVNSDIKNVLFWKNAAFVIDLALSFKARFENTFELEYDYKWMRCFNENKKDYQNIKFNNPSYVRILKLTDISNISNIIELLFRDDRAYVAVSLIKSSFLSHECCYICETSARPYHDHLTSEPNCWEQAIFIPKMEVAIVQACRAVEGLLGDPPNKTSKSRLIKYKEKWEKLLRINPDDIYEKGGISYIDFYYYLINSLRNPSAHNNGIINFKLKREELVKAQCFAVKIAIEYFSTNMLSLKAAGEKLKFNDNLLKRAK